MTARAMIEEALVVAALQDAAVLGTAGVEAGHFSSLLCRKAWEHMLLLAGKGKPSDPVSVADSIRAATGDDVLSELVNLVTDSVGSPSAAPAYAERLRAIDAEERSERLLRAMIAGKVGREEGLERLSEILTETVTAGKPLEDYLAEVLDWISGGERPAVSTGLRDLDARLGGFYNGDLVVVAARPSQGKTALSANLMRRAAKAGHAVGMISGEQPGREIAARLTALAAGVGYSRMRCPEDIQQQEWDRLTAAFAELKTQRIQLADDPAPEIQRVAQVARRWHGAGQLDLLLVDYLQILKGGDGESFRLKVGDTVTRLKALARELDVPVVVLAQVNRQVEQRPLGSDYLGRMPWMADIAESAIIEAVADQIITLYRPAVYEPDADASLAYLNVCKNRHGAIGFFEVHWDGSKMLFGDRAKEDPFSYAGGAA